MDRAVSRKRISLVGNGSYSNRGCEAIVRGTTALIRESFGECQFFSNYFPTESCRDHEFEFDSSIVHAPFPVLRRFSLPWFDDRIRKKILHQPENFNGITKVLKSTIEYTDCVLMLGGDNLSFDYNRPDKFFRLMDFILEHKKPCVIWGASVGPFTSDPEYERWAIKALNRVELICARESETFEYLRHLGVRENVILTADPAFFLPAQPIELPEKIQNMIELGCIGINFSPLIIKSIISSGSWNRDRELWVEATINLLDKIIKSIDFPVLLIPHVVSEVGDPKRDDFVLLDLIASRIEYKDRVAVLGPHYNASQTKWVISQCKSFAGARTHSTIAAISSGVPTICIGYSMKAKGIVKDAYGNLDWLINAKDLHKHDLFICKLKSIIKHDIAVRSKLAKIIPTFQSRAKKAADTCYELIN